MPEDIEPSRGDKQRMNAGIRQIITGLMLLAVTLFGVGAMTVINKQADAIVALSTSLSAQNQQFDDCKGKSATAQGCTQKVAAEPAIIIKQVGAQSVPGAQGIQGIQGIKGDPGTPCLPSIPGCRGPEGKRGPSGPTPACMLLPSKCVGQAGTDGKNGVDGKNGIDGKNGVDGKDGVNGVDGKNGTDGKDGQNGKDGAPGKNASAECTEAGNTWGPVEVSRPTPLLPVTIMTCTVNQENP